MFINLKKILYVLIVTLGVLSPAANANFSSVFSNQIFKVVTILLLITSVILISESKKYKIMKILSKPPALFFLYIFIQSYIVIGTAGSTSIIFVSTVFFVLPFFLIFIIASLLIGDTDNRFFSRLLKVVIFVAIVSMVVDLAGFGKIFAGKYATILPERLGFRQLHGFMPWPNMMATTLVVYSLLLYIFEESSVLMKMGYFATIPTLVRAHIISAVVLFVISLRSKTIKITSIVAVIVFSINVLPDLIEDSTKELSSENDSTIYRLVYITGAWAALADYPIFGIGVNRMSNEGIWKMDNYKIHTKYSLPTKLFSTDMASSDTNVTFLAEIGTVGIFLYIIQLMYFIYLAIRVNRRKYILFLLPQALWFYSFPSMLFSYNYGAFYWLLYGNLLANYWGYEQHDYTKTERMKC